MSNAAEFAGIDADGYQKYTEIKSKHKHRYLIYKFNRDGNVICEKAGQPEAKWNDFLDDLPDNDCRWSVYDFEYTTSNGQQHSKIIFVIWSPLTSPPQSKMKYASWNQMVNRALDPPSGIPHIVQGNSLKELDHDQVLLKLTRRMA